MGKFLLWYVNEQGNLSGWTKSARQAYCQQLVPVKINKSKSVLNVTVSSQDSWEVNREWGMKYLYENQQKPMVPTLCYEIKGEVTP